jgi:putative ABC transport system permease protein
VNGIVEIQIWQFFLIYLLLLVVGAIMRRCHVKQLRLLVVASVRMSVQLYLAGLILTYLFRHPHPAFTICYLAAMTGFSIWRVLRKNPGLGRRFQMIIALSIALSGVAVLLFFIYAVVGESVFNPQYAIPLGGMIMGNTMTGVSLAVRSFQDGLQGQRTRVQALLCAGAAPKRILFPFVCQALETALLPTMNSMVGMGIVSLPGMMTGQILSGTAPGTAILYQIAMMIAICTVVCLASFGSLYFGYQTLYHKTDQIITATDFEH